MSRSRVVQAPAKINLLLRVLHRRDDGYRELETLFQTISMADDVRVTSGNGARPGPEVSLLVDGPDLGPIESNLAHRAASAFRDETGFAEPVAIHLKKRIPAGAGLGGGSSDAAAVLRCLAELAEVDDPNVLHRVATALGSDVAFFLGPSALALGRGRGELLTPLAPLPQAHLVVAMPPVHVSTVAAYRALSEARGHDRDPHGGRRIFDVEADWTWNTVVGYAENDFEPVVAPLHREIAASLLGLREEGARVAMLSGSGAAGFGLFEDEQTARAAAETLERRYGWPFECVRTLREPPRIRVPRGG